MKKQAISEILAVLLIFMFLYASFSKYFDWSGFQRAMFNQPFSHGFAWVTIIGVPPIEILTSILLFKKRRLAGFLLSFLLMLIFTGYIALILLNFYPKVPCSCGGVISSLTWAQHLIFNIFFLLVSFLGWLLEQQVKRQRIPACNAS